MSVYICVLTYWRHGLGYAHTEELGCKVMGEAVAALTDNAFLERVEA
ncbi:MAG: hypothetical protein N3H31_05375 [Candidatus Nezhaarchaeota archaeon]|nr:hypothetical protein [Candidatus Nezhaarchaeota archaeon]